MPSARQWAHIRQMCKPTMRHGFATPLAAAPSLGHLRLPAVPLAELSEAHRISSFQFPEVLLQLLLRLLHLRVNPVRRRLCFPRCSAAMPFLPRPPAIAVPKLSKTSHLPSLEVV